MSENYKNKCYRLVDVLSSDRISKVETQMLYQERMGCLTKNIHRGHTYDGGQYRMHMTFIQDNAGNWINRSLRTSPVSEIVETKHGLEIHTMYSIYLFEEAELCEPEYLDAADTIELYLNDEENLFCKGFYYDDGKAPHELECVVHLGTFQDSCILCIDGNVMQSVCRYFPRFNSIQFYNSIPRQDSYRQSIVIHNIGETPLRVTFQGGDAEWTIQPGDTETIIPPERKKRR